MQTPWNGPVTITRQMPRHHLGLGPPPGKSRSAVRRTRRQPAFNDIAAKLLQPLAPVGVAAHTAAGQHVHQPHDDLVQQRLQLRLPYQHVHVHREVGQIPRVHQGLAAGALFVDPAVTSAGEFVLTVHVVGTLRSAPEAPSRRGPFPPRARSLMGGLQKGANAGDRAPI